eukprot:GHVS01004286.1.p1 GENE.GHVS01004286.1~~GHVS01004286.1.p1  ORF type:complete len:103 (-),score=11.85 GHVS01004286.1:196-504(-)
MTERERESHIAKQSEKLRRRLPTLFTSFNFKPFRQLSPHIQKKVKTGNTTAQKKTRTDASMHRTTPITTNKHKSHTKHKNKDKAHTPKKRFCSFMFSASNSF